MMENITLLREELNKMKNNAGDEDIVTRGMTTSLTVLDSLDRETSNLEENLLDAQKEVEELRQKLATRDERVEELEKEVADLKEQILVGPSIAQETEKLELIEIKGLLDTIVTQQSKLTISYEGLKEIAGKQAENTRSSIKVLKDNIELVGKVSRDNSSIKKDMVAMKEEQGVIKELVEKTVEDVEDTCERTVEEVKETCKDTVKELNSNAETVIMEASKVKEELFLKNKEMIDDSQDVIKTLFDKHQADLEDYKKDNEERFLDIENDQERVNNVIEKVKGFFTGK